MGGLFIAVVLAFPRGLAGLVTDQLIPRLRKLADGASHAPSQPGAGRMSVRRQRSWPTAPIFCSRSRTSASPSTASRPSNELNLYVDKGELRVIIGPNGAGKTTVLDLICGRTQRFRKARSSSRTRRSPAARSSEIVRLGIGRKFQTPTIYEDLTVFENLELSLPRGRNVAGALFWKRTDEVARAGAATIAAMIFLQDHLDRLAGTLSHGQKQWLEIGMLLIQDPGAADARRAGRRHERVGARQDRRAAQARSSRTAR